MANSITYIEDRTTVESGIISPSSRYRDSRLIYYGDANKITLTTYRRASSKQSDQDRYMVVTARTQYRPDLASQEAYGTPDFWWKIMEFNGIKDVMDFTIGINITLPADVLF